MFAQEAPVLDPLPDALQAAVETHERLLANTQPDRELLQSVVEALLRWDPGDTITVAFYGGPPDVHRAIADAAQAWTEHANLTLDFGEENGTFRSWSPADRRYAADIRIGFDAEFQPGYWSLVGQNSVQRRIAGPGAPSMNFGGFDATLPDDYAATVLHEFGHALGFQHEHAHPSGGCDDEFRWSDDRGYRRTADRFGQFVPDAEGRRPGIYTVMAGPPNRWSKSKVDANLRQLEASNAFQLGRFDRLSIMKYHFPEWMFTRGTASVCYTERNLALSPGDIQGARRAYPRSAAEAREHARRGRDALNAALPALDEDLGEVVRKRLEALAGR
jgi:hypothetical protein